MTEKINTDQSSLAKSGIACLYSPGGSIGQMVWLQRMFWLRGGGQPTNLPSPWGSGTAI